MKNLAALTLIVTATSIAISPAYSKDGDYHKKEIKITNQDNHNAMVNQCMKTALERHPGAITEVEVEVEKGKTIIDVDVMGKDGKKWEVECDAATGKVLEDKEEHDKHD